MKWGIKLKRDILIEVCCGSVDDAIESEKAGANRVELNSALFLGGLTPSIGEIIEAKRVLQIPVAVMIRPRRGGFCYTDSEFNVMIQDTKMAVKHGADGIVFGILNEDGTIDVDRCEKIIKLSGEKEVIFHRAIDVVPDPFQAIDTLVNLGVKRVLTKGQENTIEAGMDLLKELIEYANGRIEILPAGCKIHNVERVVNELAIDQIHINSHETRLDKSVLMKPHVYFGSSLRPEESTYDIISTSFINTIHKKITK
ncbi:copper homeostasis protein CutC [Mycoplasmatota bacterium]|nr:copper homeostasis protein CutC [Mycoplasmatota bacterium]